MYRNDPSRTPLWFKLWFAFVGLLGITTFTFVAFVAWHFIAKIW